MSALAWWCAAWHLASQTYMSCVGAAGGMTSIGAGGSCSVTSGIVLSNYFVVAIALVCRVSKKRKKNDENGQSRTQTLFTTGKFNTFFTSDGLVLYMAE